MVSASCIDFRNEQQPGAAGQGQPVASWQTVGEQGSLQALRCLTWVFRTTAVSGSYLSRLSSYRIRPIVCVQEATERPPHGKGPLPLLRRKGTGSASRQRPTHACEHVTHPFVRMPHMDQAVASLLGAGHQLNPAAGWA